MTLAKVPSIVEHASLYGYAADNTTRSTGGNAVSESTAAEKILGLYTLLLMSTRPWSLSELAKKFDCSKPTMIRSLARIERIEGIALKSELRLQGGRRQKWYWLERSPNIVERQHMRLSTEEMRLLTFCRDLSTPFLPVRLRKMLDGSLRRASVLLAESDSCHERVEPLVQPALLGVIDYAPLQDTLNTVMRAIQQRVVCEITYAPPGKAERTYEMAVTRMVSGRHALYAHGWKVGDRGRAEAKHPLFLAVHRMCAARLTRRAHELHTPKEEEGFGLIDGKVFRVTLRIAKEAANYVRERVFGPEQRIESADDGSVLLSFMARSEKELLAWALSFGRSACVLEPQDFAKRVRSEAYAILRNR